MVIERSGVSRFPSLDRHFIVLDANSVGPNSAMNESLMGRTMWSSGLMS